MVPMRGGDQFYLNSALVLGYLLLVTNWATWPTMVTNAASIEVPQSFFQNGLPISSPERHLRALSNSQSSFRPMRSQWNNVEESQPGAATAAEEQSHQSLELETR